MCVYRELKIGYRCHIDSQQLKMYSSQGWFPAAFLLDENAVKEPENFKVMSDYKAASAQELAAKKGQVILLMVSY